MYVKVVIVGIRGHSKVCKLCYMQEKQVLPINSHLRQIIEIWGEQN